jgi:ribosomal-protein-alanine N-acetyltransferase
MRVETEELVYRAVREGDRDAWISAMQASSALHAPWSPKPGPEDTLAVRFERLLGQHRSGASFKGLALSHAGDIVAFVNLNDIVRSVSQSANVGWAVHVAFAGKGLTTLAVCAALDLAFAPVPHGLGLHRVSCAVMPTNTRSLRVAEKCGFRREGLAKKLVCIASEWEDHLLFAKLAEEHEAGRAVSPRG